MTWLRIMTARVTALFGGRRLEKELDDELRSHLELLMEENQCSGMSPEEARYAALRSFGGVEQVKETYREQRGLPIIETLVQDLRFGLRMLSKNPGFTCVAILTLGLGIGANTAIFSLIDALMLRPLPVKEPQQLVQLGNVGPVVNTSSFSYPAYRRFRDANKVFTGVLADSWLLGLDAEVNGVREPLSEGRLVSGNFFTLLGLNAVVGRVFTAEDDKVHRGSPVAVISYDYWKRRFALNPSAVGKTLKLNGTPLTIIGVTPPGFFGLEVGHLPDVYVPMMMQPAFREEGSILDDPQSYWMRIMGRLRPGVSREMARADLSVIHSENLEEMPKKDWSARMAHDFLLQRLELLPAASGLAFDAPREFSEPLRILMAMVALVLLIACANVANLLLARATARQKEIAVRLAIGAGRFRLVRQLLTESLLLACAGGALGLLLAYLSAAPVVSLMSVGRARLLLDPHPDLRVLAFTALVSLLVAILFGLVPALRATRLDLTPALKENARVTGTNVSRLGLGKALVIAQAALSLLLLFGAGLFVRTLQNLEHVDGGFNRDNVLLFSVDPTKSGHRGPEITTLYQRLLERIEATPGVRSASLSLWGPITGGGGWDNETWVEGYTPQPNEDMTVYLNSVGPKYFETIGSQVLMGREFTSRDSERASKVAIINRTMARRYFGNDNPLGRKFGWGQPGEKDRPEFEIVGIVEDSKYGTLREKVPSTAYLDCFQGPLGGMTIEVRTAVRPAALIPQIRNDLQAISKDLPPRGFTTLAEHVDESLGHERLMASLSSLFGALALLVASIGLYGVLSYAVARQTHEIGIRMALGAPRAKILGMVMRESWYLVVVGMGIGLPSALVVSRLIASMLFGLTAADPVTIALAAIVMLGVATLAGYLPARRASRVDPIVALRYE